MAYHDGVQEGIRVKTNGIQHYMLQYSWYISRNKTESNVLIAVIIAIKTPINAISFGKYHAATARSIVFWFSGAVILSQMQVL